MEISSEKLSKLAGWKYEEYKTLSKIDFEGKKYKDFTSFLFQFVLCLLVGSIYILIRNEDVSNWVKIFGFTFLIGIVFPLSWVPTLLISDVFYTRIYSHFSHKTKDYLRLKELEIYFVDTEKEIEIEAVSILSGVEKAATLRLSDNKNISSYLRRKRNPALYITEIEKVRKNYELNQKTLSVLDKNIGYIKFNLEKRKHFEKLQLDLRFEHIHFTGLLASIGRSINRTSSSNRNAVRDLSNADKMKIDYQETRKPTRNYFWRKSNSKAEHTSEPLEINNEPSLSKSKSYQSENKITPDEILGKSTKKDDEIIKPRESRIIELPESSLPKNTQGINQLEFDFKRPDITVKTTNDIPVKRTTPKYEPIIKASPKFYLELAGKKMEIGMKGELLVMEHERQRLIEKGENPDVRLRHKSVKDGDGFGYDILSFKNGEKIYIEVKTTVGSFWSNLFFTQNEYEKMNELGEQYYLYRICNLDLETNKGDLFIFGGKEMIDSFFDFKSKMYVLTQKTI